ncbi:MAG: class A beta-lactamase-related serine hydrolase [Chamaesiphon sp.]|nr:class A beta-lactamase-related serine hydrolase [Chamaesiphon sp.]
MALNSNAKRSSKPISPERTARQPRVLQADPPVTLLIKLVRLAICGLGISAIAGTTISVINPPRQNIVKKVAPVPRPDEIASLNLTKPSIKLNQQLQSKLPQTKKSTTAKKSGLDASYIFVNIDSGEYSELGSDRILPAASTIKLPILIALFQDIDAQKIKLTEQLTITDRTIAGGSGDLRNKKPGSQVSVLVTATKMMTISDNTATNLLIDRLGGKAALNQRFRQWGLQATTINQPLPDLTGTNTTTAKELSRSLLAIQRGKIVSDASRAQILDMMSHTLRNTMLPRGLGKGAKIAHKTGDIGTLVADVGSIKSASGKNYLAAVLVNRPHNSPAGPELVRQMSKIVYDYFEQPSNPNPIPQPLKPKI